MKIYKLLLLAVCSFAVNQVLAQNVDDIISKHLDAVGGKDKLGAVKSIKMEGTAEFMGQSAPTSTIILVGKGFRNESEFQGKKVVRVYTDKGGWTINPFAGSDDPQALPDEQYKAGAGQIYVEPFYEYAARGSKAELAGQEKVGDVNAYKIRLTSKDSSVQTFLIDPSTYYIVQVQTTTSMMGQDMQVKSTLSDFKKTDSGIVMPYTIDLAIGDQFSMTSKLNKVDINQPVDSAIFEMKK
ncbi:MAG TPA: hypothetical protein VGC95_00140 [Chitinophagaceae bacterium]|jgi:hypothetical protein